MPSSNYKLITKTYDISYSGLPAATIAGLGTVDIAKHPGERTENLIKVELAFGSTISPLYLSAELHVLVGEDMGVTSYIPSSYDDPCGQVAYYPIGSAQYNSRYSHLLYPSEFVTYFAIYFESLVPHLQLPDYWQMPIYVSTPNYAGHLGAVITTYYPSNLPINHDY